MKELILTAQKLVSSFINLSLFATHSLNLLNQKNLAELLQIA